MYGTSCRQPFFFLFFDDGGALLHADDALSGVTSESATDPSKSVTTASNEELVEKERATQTPPPRVQSEGSLVSQESLRPTARPRLEPSTSEASSARSDNPSAATPASNTQRGKRRRRPTFDRIEPPPGRRRPTFTRLPVIVPPDTEEGDLMQGRDGRGGVEPSDRGSESDND